MLGLKGNGRSDTDHCAPLGRPERRVTAFRLSIIVDSDSIFLIITPSGSVGVNQRTNIASYHRGGKQRTSPYPTHIRKSSLRSRWGVKGEQFRLPQTRGVTSSNNLTQHATDPRLPPSDRTTTKTTKLSTVYTSQN